MNSFYSQEELEGLGFKYLGKNVKISRKTSIYTPEKISVGNNVRIDDFCILSGEIRIGNYVHLAAYCGLFGGGGIVMEDFSGLSSRVSIYSSTDDYSGEFLTNPTVPDEYKNIQSGMVILKKHSIVGASSVILPNVIIGEGTAIGSLSLVNKSLDPWMICTGVPCKALKPRSKKLLFMEKLLHSNNQ